MKYFADLLGASVLLIGVFLYIFLPTPALEINKLQLESLDGYPINLQKEDFILHIGSVECLPCKRDTQVLMRYHYRYPEHHIIDANLLYQPEDKEFLIKWKKKLDIKYQVAVIASSSTIYERIPTTYVFSNGEITKLFGSLRYEDLVEATHKDI